MLLLTAFLLFISIPLSASDYYNKNFTGQRLRVDVVFAGNSSTQNVYLVSMNAEPQWSGSVNNLTDPFDYGEYQFRLINNKDEIIFSKGFNSLFQEWRTTSEAREIKRSFSSSYTMPFPRDSARLVFLERDKETGHFVEISRFPVIPEDKFIIREIETAYQTDTLLYNGNPSNKVDLLFVAEGYTQDQIPKFRKDAERFISYLFDINPYKSRKEDFNIWILMSDSEDPGTDIPHENIWRRTAMNSHFYTFGIERYLTAPDHTRIAKAASQSHYDLLYIIVNTEKYGGGGIYNFYGLSMADHPLSAEVFVHELGHSFAGLGDEYYSSEVAYDNFYNLNNEPWEPNLTTLVKFCSKWKHLVTPGTPLPTPNEPEYKNVTGVFEGGGYMTKGIYRPALDCRMKSNTAEGFCPVCQHAINKMIDYYTK